MFDNQMFIIIGGICFAPTIALIIVKDFLEYINVRLGTTIKIRKELLLNKRRVSSLRLF